MKKIKLTNGLKLSPQSLSKLQESQMEQLRGGRSEDPFSSSGPRCTCRTGSCKDDDLI